MSYILDALRRAEAQRSRGAVPTLHAPVLGPAPAGAPAAPHRTWLVAGVVGLLLVAVAALWFAWRQTPRQAPAPVAVVTAPTMPPPAPVPAPAPMPEPVARVAPPEPRVAVRPTLPQPPPSAESAPRAAAPRGPSPTQVGAAPAAPAPAPPAPAAAPPAPPPRPLSAEAAAAPEVPRPAVSPVARAPAAAPPVARRDLPAELQRELPALALNGTVYSPDPAQRMALVNGEVWREGDRLGPDLVVDEIRRQDAVLRYKGQRFILGP